MFKRFRSRSGMSLIEILVVLVIMGTVPALVGRNVLSRLAKSKVDTTRLQMNGFQTSLQDYYLGNNTYPTTEQGLEALIIKPSVGPEPTGYSPDGYLKGSKIPKDGWKRDFLYESDGSKYTIMSYGKDGVEGGTGYGVDIIIESE